MGFTNAEQLYELFLSGGLGFLLGGYYDVFRILRRLLHSSAVSVFMQDLLFFATSAVIVFLFSLAMTDGTVRLHVLLAVAAGFAAYRRTVGKALLYAVCGVLNWLRRFCDWLKELLLVPYRQILRALRFIGGRLYKAWQNIVKKSEKIFKKGLQPTREVLYNHDV